MIRQRIELADRPVSYREAGSGNPVVLVPGLGLSGRFYDRSFEAFATAGLRLLVPDLPGFGGTGGAPLGHSVSAMRDFVLDFSAALGLTRPIWVGHSLGAQVVVQLAAEAPHHARAVVLVGPTGAPGARKLPRQAWALLREARRAPVPVVLRVLSDYVRVSPLAYVGTWLRYGRDRPLERLRAVTCPVLVLVGTRDPVIDPLFLDVMLRRLPDVRLERVPGAGHALPRAQAAQFNSAVTAFCRIIYDGVGA